MPTAKIGTPEWRPISETRHATIEEIFKVVCYGCAPKRVIYEGSIFFMAEQQKALHDKSHSDKVAECCMYSTEAVCKCGNLLV